MERWGRRLAAEELVEVTEADTLRARFFPEESTQKKGLHACNVFQRLHQDSQTRIKQREVRPPTHPSRQTERRGPPIEETLLQRHAESQARMERLKARRDEEEMKEVMAAPRINDYSRFLADKKTPGGCHSHCSFYEQGSASTPKSGRVASVNTTAKGSRSPAFDASVVSSKLSKYSDLMLPDDWQPVAGKDDHCDDEEAPFELTEQEVASPPPVPEVKKAAVRLEEVLEAAEPMEIPEAQGESYRCIVSNATVSRERAMEYQQMVKRHLELIRQKPQFS